MGLTYRAFKTLNSAEEKAQPAKISCEYLQAGKQSVVARLFEEPSVTSCFTRV